MLSYKMDFSSCAIMPGFGKSSHKYNSLLTKFVQCKWSECELPETSLMRFGAMHIIVNKPLRYSCFLTTYQEITIISIILSNNTI